MANFAFEGHIGEVIANYTLDFFNQLLLKLVLNFFVLNFDLRNGLRPHELVHSSVWKDKVILLLREVVLRHRLAHPGHWLLLLVVPTVVLRSHRRLLGNGISTFDVHGLLTAILVLRRKLRSLWKVHDFLMGCWRSHATCSGADPTSSPLMPICLVGATVACRYRRARELLAWFLLGAVYPWRWLIELCSGWWLLTKLLGRGV